MRWCSKTKRTKNIIDTGERITKVSITNKKIRNTKKIAIKEIENVK